jgi:fatty-acyl-CoA synthase
MFTPLTPLRCLDRAVELYGSRVGVVCGGRRFTYSEFGERCRRLASALRRHGIAPGEIVAYLSFNNHQLLEGYFGVPQARGILLPLNVRLTPAELAAILNHAGARMLIFEEEFARVAAELRAACPGIADWVAIGETVPPAALNYEELIAAGEPERADIYSIDENAVAELFYTSGSTGTPKGVMLSHRTLYLHALAVMTLYVEIESMVYLHTIPFFHANGWGGPQALTYLGVKQVMVRRFDPPTVFRLIEEHRGTDMYLVPAMANALVNHPEVGRYDLSSLRRVFIGGAASTPTLIERVERAFGCRCFSGYGLTETAPVLAAAIPKAGLTFSSDEERYRRQAMTGFPVIGVEVRVVDNAMNDVPRDGRTVGEIVTRGDHSMEGYWRDAAQTAEAMAGGWFHTGDMATWDEEGFLQIVDRKKEIIISGGENISSLEVESAIASHPAVYECSVVAAPDEQWGEVPAAFVVLKPGQTLTADELRAYLAGRLARFKLPKHVFFREEPLPKSGTGKIRKAELKEALWAGRDRRVQG